MTAKDVSAVIVTRGDVSLAPILDTLPYGEIIVWDNSQREDSKCLGRYLALEEATRDVVYFQDDDVLFTDHGRLLAAYEPGRITVNMPSPWYEECGYDTVGCALPGAGSLAPRDLPWRALNRYLAEWPRDDLFLTFCDVAMGILAPSKRVDFGYTVLPHASRPGRISTTPGYRGRQMQMIDRAVALREAVAA